MDVNKLTSLYESLQESEEYKYFEEKIKQPNIFRILNISNYEIRHSNFLGWLFDPNENHGLGNYMLENFLIKLFENGFIQSKEYLSKESNEDQLKVLREWNNIDLLLLADEFVICIENKIFSDEHSNQLERYRKIIQKEFSDKKQLFIYLTPYGQVSKTEKEIYIPVSYQVIIDILEDINDEIMQSLKTSIKSYIIEYIDTLKRDIMGNDELIGLSREIYEKNKELFDYIGEISTYEESEAKDDIGDKLSQILESKGYILGSRNQTYVRFTTNEVEKLTYINKKTSSWKNKETFLFELVLRPKSNLIRFVTVVGPCDEEYNRSRLIEIIEEIPESGSSKGPRWSSHHGFSYKFNWEEIYQKTEEEIMTELSVFVDSFEEIVHSYEKHFKQNEKELLILKSVSESS